MSLLLAALLTTAAAQPPVLSDQPSPFCSILRERVTPALATEAADNEAIARILPALLDYHDDFNDLNISRAATAAYRLKKIEAQLQSHQAALRATLDSVNPGAPDAPDRELLEQLKIAMSSVFAEQQGVQRALKAFINEEESAEDATNGRVTMAGQLAENSSAGIADARAHIQDVGSYLATIAAGAISLGTMNEVAYARPIVANTQHIVSQEPYLHDLVNLAVERCYARRQAPIPTTKSTPRP